MKKNTEDSIVAHNLKGEGSVLPHEDWRNCKNCGASHIEQEMRNFDPVFRDADIYCSRCGSFVRVWDPN